MDETKYVVLFSGVGKWDRGDVLPASVLGDAANIQRLTGLGAVREATKEEAKHEHVTLPEKVPTTTVSFEVQLAAKDREIERLKAELRASREEAQLLKARPVPQPSREDSKAFQQLLSEKDKVAAEKDLRIAELEKEIQRLNTPAPTPPVPPAVDPEPARPEAKAEPAKPKK